MTAVSPQNGVIGLQTIFSPTVLNELKFGYNGAKTRVNGQAPTVNGLDLSAITLNISGNTANFNLPGQGTSAGTAVPGGLVRANSATNGRGQPYTPYTLSLIDNVNWTKGGHNFEFGGEVARRSTLHRSSRRDDLHVLQSAELPEQHASERPVC